MTNHLQDLGPDAVRAVVAAEADAVAMGHEQIGTGHLLLGLLGDEAGSAHGLLAEAGARLHAVRRKVREALPPAPDGAPAPEPPLPATPRAERALGRAVRYSRQQRADGVTGEHLLWGVLDVEGTAGQVLRGLGLDVDRLRRKLEIHEPLARGVPTEPGRTIRAVLPCPACGVDLDDHVAYRTVQALGEHGVRRANVFSCGGCGHVLGASSA